GITPSFFDELLSVIDELHKARQRVVIHHAPTDASAKYVAVARTHSYQIASHGATWRLDRTS
ncbi:MAG: hypothetical protein ACT4PT_04115, partial [Methanobacteriota archaeon]